MATMKGSLPGQCSNANDYVRDVIHKDQERRKAIATVQAAITEGVESGNPQPFDATAFKLRIRKCHVVR